MVKKIILILILSLLTGTAYAESPTVKNAQRMKFPNPLDNIRPLAIEAIKNGEARGVLAGDTALFIQNKVGATSPLRVNVTTLVKYKQSGCARLNAQFLQDNVQVPGESETRNREINFQFNYCIDGKPPLTEGKEYVINNPFGQPSPVNIR